MSTIKHHPSDDILLGYVAGNYETAFNIALSTHVDACSKCRETVRFHQSLGGQILEDQKPTPMKVGASAILNRLDGVENVSNDVPITAQANRDGLVNSVLLQEYLGGNFGDVKWQKLSPSIKQHVLSVDGKASARLLWIAPGQAVPAHGHTGEEFSMIVAGGYYDGDEAYTKGDFHFADHKAPHMPTAMEDGPCIVLAATDSPLVFRNFIPRLLQPLFKI